MDRFGCERCWPDDADEAVKASGMLLRDHELVADTHFDVLILACPVCGQRFLSVFTEMIDWSGGNDDQSWIRIPITNAEASYLIEQQETGTISTLEAIGIGRRSLRDEYPSRGAPRKGWSTGIFVGPHD